MAASVRPLLRSIGSSQGRYWKRWISDGEVKAQNLLDQIYAAVIQQRFRDIVVIKTKFNTSPRFIILANAFSRRHLVNGTEELNRHFKREIKESTDQFAKLAISSEWNVIDVDAIILHLFSESCRAHYDIEQLWAVGSEYDDLSTGKAEVPDFDERINKN